MLKECPLKKALIADWDVTSRFLLGKHRGEDAHETEPAEKGVAGKSEAQLQRLVSSDGTVSFEPEADGTDHSDADLEASVLDTLTDTVLTGLLDSMPLYVCKSCDHFRQSSQIQA